MQYEQLQSLVHEQESEEYDEDEYVEYDDSDKSSLLPFTDSLLSGRKKKKEMRISFGNIVFGDFHVRILGRIYQTIQKVIFVLMMINCVIYRCDKI